MYSLITDVFNGDVLLDLTAPYNFLKAVAMLANGLAIMTQLPGSIVLSL